MASAFLTAGALAKAVRRTCCAALCDASRENSSSVASELPWKNATSGVSYRRPRRCDVLNRVAQTGNTPVVSNLAPAIPIDAAGGLRLRFILFAVT